MQLSGIRPYRLIENLSLSFEILHISRYKMEIRILKQNVSADEQVILKHLTTKAVAKRPVAYFPKPLPLPTLSYKKRKAVSLTALECES
jgi:hypothetical protein